jgi:hypothetical protein
MWQSWGQLHNVHYNTQDFQEHHRCKNITSFRHGLYHNFCFRYLLQLLTNIFWCICKTQFWGKMLEGEKSNMLLGLLLSHQAQKGKQGSRTLCTQQWFVRYSWSITCTHQAVLSRGFVDYSENEDVEHTPYNIYHRGASIESVPN